MNRQERRSPEFRKRFEAEQAKQSAKLTRVSRAVWPPCEGKATPVEVWRSNKFLVVVYSEGDYLRMTVNRASLGKAGGWKDAITWDELQSIKQEIGRGDQWAVECFPPDADLVNVASMRHLWLLNEPPEFGWGKRERLAIWPEATHD